MENRFRITIGEKNNRSSALNAAHIIEQLAQLGTLDALSDTQRLPESDGVYTQCQLTLLESETTFRNTLNNLSNKYPCDIIALPDGVAAKAPMLAVFDMDSTLIQAEVIDLLADAAGIGTQVASITERAMNGELDFDDSFRERLALLKGLDADVLHNIANRLPVTAGAKALLKSLKNANCRTILVSGGFQFFAEHLQQELEIDEVYANELHIIDGKVSGEVMGNIVNGESKLHHLQQTMTALHLDANQVMAVGDGANDIPMLTAAGIGVAFHGKPLVVKQADLAIQHLGLDLLIPALRLTLHQTA